MKHMKENNSMPWKIKLAKELNNQVHDKGLEMTIRRLIFRNCNDEDIKKAMCEYMPEYCKDQSEDEELDLKEYEKKEHNMRIVKEGVVSSPEIFKTMKQVKMTDAEWSKAKKSGKYVTDGYGRIYELPTEGYSDTFVYDDRIFRYNYGKKRLEWISNNEKVIDSTILSPSSFVDNPVYWFETYYDELEYER